MDYDQHCGSQVLPILRIRKNKRNGIKETESANEQTQLRVEIRGRRCWHSNSQKGFVHNVTPSWQEETHCVNGVNVINMLSVCSAVYCTVPRMDKPHVNIQLTSAHSEDLGTEHTLHLRLDYVTSWWMVMPSAGEASWGNETKSMCITKSGHVHSLSSFTECFTAIY